MTKGKTKINKEQFEKLINDGYGALAIACFFGVSRNTLCSWVKDNYDGKRSSKSTWKGSRNNGKT